MMDHLWVILSLVSAFSAATSGALIKKALTRHNEYLVAWLVLLISLPVFYGALLSGPLPRIDRNFYSAIAPAIPLEAAATILYVKALKVSPLSLTLPFLSLTPLFLTVVSFILLGERLSAIGLIGILCISAGSYTLHLKESGGGLFQPLRAIAREKGSVLMILVAFIYSLTSSYGKMAIENSSPIFFAAAYYTLLACVMTPLALYEGRRELLLLRQSRILKSVILPGLFSAVGTLCYVTAIHMTKVAYMISVKRLSLLLGVYYGYILFNEVQIRERLAGTALMLGGFILIVLYGG